MTLRWWVAALGGIGALLGSVSGALALESGGPASLAAVAVLAGMLFWAYAAISQRAAAQTGVGLGVWAACVQRGALQGRFLAVAGTGSPIAAVGAVLMASTDHAGLTLAWDRQEGLISSVWVWDQVLSSLEAREWNEVGLGEAERDVPEVVAARIAAVYRTLAGSLLDRVAHLSRSTTAPEVADLL